MTPLRTAEFLGVNFVAEQPNRVVASLLESAATQSSAGLVVHLVPAHSLPDVPRDPDFRAALEAPAIVVPDGRWLEILTRKAVVPLFQLRGTDLLLRLCEAGVSVGLTHYFLGSTERALQLLEVKLSLMAPGVTIAGSEPYPFGVVSSEDRATLAKRIRLSGADVVWMGISSPRQNKEAVWLAEMTGVMVVCVGAALEFVAGEKKSAPTWVQRIGVEWLFRFLTEPRRLWRRYVLGSLSFLSLYLRHSWGHKHEG